MNLSLAISEMQNAAKQINKDSGMSKKMGAYGMPWFWCGVAATVSLLCFCGSTAFAVVSLPKVFGDNMVLQRGMPVVVWGWAGSGEAVSVRVGDAKAAAKANAKGEWRVELPAMRAGGPVKMSVKGANEVVFDNVMVGEVWLCCGQSNMEMGIKSSADADTEIPAANYPGIRLLKIPKLLKQAPQNDVNASWKVCTPESVATSGEWGGISAVGYYFAKDLHKALDIPVGLIDASWGGTRIEPWTPPEGFAKIPELSLEYEIAQVMNPNTELHKQRLEKVLGEVERWAAQARKSIADKTPAPVPPQYPNTLLPPAEHIPSTLYNGMLHPIIPFSIRGSVWYQGEANIGEGMLYVEKTKALVNGWREVWSNPNLQYFFVQLPPCSCWGGDFLEFREAQTAAAKAIPYSGMAVISDTVDDLNNLHPKNKKEVGRRLSLLAQAKTYGKPVVCEGPSLKSLSVEGSKVRLAMDGVGGGLVSRDGKPLDWFEMLDRASDKFVKADAAIEGDAIVLSSPDVKKPSAVRFAWCGARPNLMNKEGLPGVPFRAKVGAERDPLEMVPEAKDYQLVYELDLSKLGPNIVYDVDNRSKISKPFDRVAYVLELELPFMPRTYTYAPNANSFLVCKYGPIPKMGQSQYVYVSVDAFTDNLGKIGVPTFASGASFQRQVDNMSIYSNAPGVVTGKGIKGGSMEFWPNNTSPANGKDIPGAAGDGYDFGDQPVDPVNGTGSMQIHNSAAKQTVFAINSWKSGSQADLGIGNSKDGSKDWTNARNASSYSKKRLRVFVHTP